jgi:hypothetical protein
MSRCDRVKKSVVLEGIVNGVEDADKVEAFCAICIDDTSSGDASREAHAIVLATSPTVPCRFGFGHTARDLSF